MNNALRGLRARLQGGGWVMLGWVGLVASYGFPTLGWLAWFWPSGLMVLAIHPSSRVAAYGALLLSTTAYALHLRFFWTLFGFPALLLWLILALWILFFTLGFRFLYHRLLVLPDRRGDCTPLGLLGRWVVFVLMGAAWWTFLEWVRSEGYPLKFSWLNVGYALGQQDAGLNVLSRLGVYGSGCAAALWGCGMVVWRWAASSNVVKQVGGSVWVSGKQVGTWTWVAVFGMVGASWVSPAKHEAVSQVRVTGIQLEFPTETEVLKTLDRAAQAEPKTELFVLGEYTFTEALPDSVREWCRRHQKYLIVGAQDPAPGGDSSYYNTAFVIDPRGEVVFKQAKSVPIQFFRDGLPARSQDVWQSPWGRLGICICYDLSYAGVVRGLVKGGAQAIVVPTMDKEDWGRAQHELHALVAPARAAEFGIPIFRVASSGFSQWVDPSGKELARGGYPGQGTWIAGNVELVRNDRR